MWPDWVSNSGPLTYKSGALPTVLCGPAFFLGDLDVSIFTIWMSQFLVLEVSSECFNSYCILQRNSYTNSADPDQTLH